MSVAFMRTGALAASFLLFSSSRAEGCAASAFWPRHQGSEPRCLLPKASHTLSSCAPGQRVESHLPHRFLARAASAERDRERDPIGAASGAFCWQERDPERPARATIASKSHQQASKPERMSSYADEQSRVRAATRISSIEIDPLKECPAGGRIMMQQAVDDECHEHATKDDSTAQKKSKKGAKYGTRSNCDVLGREGMLCWCHEGKSQHLADHGVRRVDR